MYSYTSKMIFLFLFIYFPILITSQSIREGATFNFTNQGELGPIDDEYYQVDEYSATHRVIRIFNNPFQFMFYNTTPNEFTLAIRMGTRWSRSTKKWVWEANRGRPVGDGATFKLGKDGNMVLADADGRVAWQTNTANKNVVGFKFLSNGNLVLHDKNNNYVWQSFDNPTDTLLVGQSLRASGGPKTLVSRVSEKVNANGPYSMVLEQRALNLYYKTKNSPRPYLYYSYGYDFWSVDRGAINYVSFNVSSEELYSYGYDLVYGFQVVNATDSSDSPIDRLLARPKFNSTLSFLRLEIDGNVKTQTYFPRIAITDARENNFDAWENTYSLFSERTGENECYLPEKCGNFGLCENSQCVACPTSTGLAGWSESCQPPTLSSCAANSFTYYKLVGVDHFLSRNTKGDGPIKENECKGKCSKNCKCLGYFYHTLSSSCWAVNDLKTLTKVANSTHVGYIKTPIR